ncbi:tRNA (cytosine-5-)-methyltransferase ncl1 [Sporothrix eucalyptigena]|uniref:tRNA (Cytosine-5-)-methyltransferase ncl1 n=1 Tax=Sporothrix eucalyptigena TaxID=1812306 RepID=A0ABP0BFH3_9PEZI
MGRGGFKRNRGGGNRNGGRSNERYNKAYPDLVKENEKLQKYYNHLLRLEDDETEREAFWAAFRRELPHSFRFCGSKGHAQSVQKLLQTRYIPEIAQIGEYDGHPVSPPQAVPWYPDNLAWWMTTSKTVIRKFPPFAAFQKFLVSETTVGNISRQEVVSMIPPLLMDVRPGMAVLDLCAAPGSKAAQLLEMVHQGEEARVRKVMRSIEKSLAGEDVPIEEEEDEEDPAAKLSADPSDDGRATGVLVANDADYKRSHLLIHQLKRLSSPNIIVTNHDATIYPSLRLPPLPVDPNAKQPAQVQQRYLKFDRILADVPCSGDGTLRKNVNMWKEWNPGNALGLHLVQVRILVRALQMLKTGGRVVYSTCSLNPVENESVVASAIALCGGPDKVEILESHEMLPQLKRKPGLNEWKIMDKSGRFWSNWDEVEAYTASEESGGVAPSRLVPTMFANEASDKLPLERCLRVYPHLQDTGGFFIVVLQKKGEFKAKTVPTGPVVPKKTQQNQKAAAPQEAAPSAAITEDIAAAPATASAENGSTNGAGAKRPAEDDEVSVDSQAAKRLKPEGGEAEAEAEVKQEEPAVAVAEEEINEEAVEETSAAPAASNGNAEGPRPKNGGGGGAHYEEPFKYLAPDHPVVKDIQAFYHLSPRFPSDRFMVRNATGEPAKAIYYTSGLVRDILVSNTSSDTNANARSSGPNVKFVHGGVRMFVKQEAPSAEVCRWRIQAEGLPLLSGYVGEERVVHLYKKATLKALLVEMFPKFVDGEGAQLGEVGERLPSMGMGCFVVKVAPRKEDETAEALVGDVPLEPMALPLWKSFHSLNLMLPKEDRAAMLLRIFNDKTPLVNNSLKDKSKKTEEAAAAQNGEDATMADAAPATTEAADGDAAEINDYDAEDAPSS